MALPDPLAITLDGAKSLPRIIDDGLKSTYVTADSKLTLTVSHQVTSKKKRTVIRIDETIVAADPLSAVQKSMVGSTYIVFDFPLWGFDLTKKLNQITALHALGSASTNAVYTRILNGEH